MISSVSIVGTSSSSEYNDVQSGATTGSERLRQIWSCKSIKYHLSIVLSLTLEHCIKLNTG